MGREPWYESDNPTRWGWAVIRWWVLIAVLVLVVGGVAWGSKVATSDIKGRGDAVVEKNSADNRIAAQERLEQMFHDVIAADQRIATFHDALKANPKSEVAQTNYVGAVSYCQQVVQDYNGEARKYTVKDFRTADLPQQVDDLDPNTDCK